MTHAAAGEPVVGEPPDGAAGGLVTPGRDGAALAAGGTVVAGGAVLAGVPLPVHPAVTAQAMAAVDAAAYARHRHLARCTPRL